MTDNWLTNGGFIPTHHGDIVPPHIVATGQHLLAEALDITSYVYGLSQRVHALSEAVAALIPRDNDTDERYAQLLDASMYSAVSEVLEVMAQQMTGHLTTPTPDELRERFGTWAAEPYGLDQAAHLPR